MEDQHYKKSAVIIILDISGSMIENGKSILLDRAYQILVSKLALYDNVEISVSLITFGHSVKIEYIQTSLQQLPLFNYEIGGQSDFLQIIELFTQKSLSLKKKDTVIILTDGVFINYEWEDKWQNIIEEYELNVFTIQIGSCGQKTSLKKLLNGNNSNIFNSENIVNIPLMNEATAAVEIVKYNNLNYEYTSTTVEY